MLIFYKTSERDLFFSHILVHKAHWRTKKKADFLYLEIGL